MVKINPLILKYLTLKSTREEETRQRKTSIMMSISVVKFLLFVAIFYILSNPFKAIGHYFSEDEVKYVKDIQNEYGYEQFIDTENEDYIYSSEFDFSSYDFEDNNVDIVYYNQADGRWRDMPYGKTGTIGRSGCGPTSLAMVISTLTDKRVSPVEMCNWSYKNGYYCEGSGSYHSLIPAGAKHYGLKVEGVGTNAEKIISALENGKLIIAIMGKGHFTSSGHFIVLRGITEEGKILVADPISIKRSEKEWNLDLMLREARKGADVGGPFWVIGR